MQVTRIIVIRHGETAWNVDGRLQGHLDIPLNDTGLWQAQQTGAALSDAQLDAVYTSDLQRALVTAQAVAASTGTSVSVDAGLRERSFGALQGLTFAQVEETRPDDARRWRERDMHFAPPEGESLHAFHARVIHTVNHIAANHVGQHIALVAHGGVLDMLYRAATRQALDAPRSWALANASINRLLWTPSGLSLVGWGDVQHLDAQVRDETMT